MLSRRLVLNPYERTISRTQHRSLQSATVQLDVCHFSQKHKPVIHSSVKSIIRILYKHQDNDQDSAHLIMAILGSFSTKKYKLYHFYIIYFGMIPGVVLFDRQLHSLDVLLVLLCLTRGMVRSPTSSSLRCRVYGCEN